MAAPLATKIVLKNTTKMSLNERFTAYRSESQSMTNTYRQKITLQRQANSVNLRLAQQMANRPSVIAALRLKKRSLQARLGRKSSTPSNVKSRLTLSKNIANQISLRGRLGAARGKRGSPRNTNFKSGTSPMLKTRLGGGQSSGYSFTSKPNLRLQFRNRRGGSNVNRQFQPGNRQQRNNRGRRGTSRGRGGGPAGRWKFPGKQPTRQELDNQLDEYMAETKTTFDDQINRYITQI